MILISSIFANICGKGTTLDFQWYAIVQCVVTHIMWTNYNKDGCISGTF